MVGPLHKGGNEDILTYDFVHRTHIDIFGYYYPRVFTDWWADSWMSRVYESQRTLKLPGVRLVHTMEIGQRYKVQSSKEKYLRDQLEEDRITLNRCVSKTRFKMRNLVVASGQRNWGCKRYLVLKVCVLMQQRKTEPPK